MNAHEALFRQYEHVILDITKSYPNPVTLDVSGRSPSYIRQQLKQACEFYVHYAAIHSEVPRDVVEDILSLWVFSDDGLRVHIGPRRRRKEQIIPKVSITQADPSLLRPVDCSSFQIFDAVCLLKNQDVIPFPLTLINLSEENKIYALETYPNIDITPIEGKPSQYTIL